MWSHWFTVVRSNAQHHNGDYPLKTEMKQIGAIETPDVGEVDLSGGRSPGRRRARNVFPEERLAVVEQDLDQISKEFSHFTDVIGNRP